MKTIYSVLSKGKELETQFTSIERANAFLFNNDLYMPSVEEEQVSDCAFSELKDDEAKSDLSCEEWGELTDLQVYQSALIGGIA